MATFKVGQRVKKVFDDETVDASPVVPIGTTGTIIGTTCEDGAEWAIRYDGLEAAECGVGSFIATSLMLAPLTDPKADAFLESIKRLKPYEEPKRINEKQHAE